MSKKVKRYNLSFPIELYNEIKEVADRKQIAVIDLLRRFIKIGLVLIKIEDNPDAALIIREGNKEKEIVFY